MIDISLFWVAVVVAITGVVYAICRGFVKGRRKRMPLLALLATTLLYSGIGIAYKNVDKVNVLYFTVFVSVMGLAYCFFVNLRIKVFASEGVPRLIDDTDLWSRKFTKQCYIALMILYIVLRCSMLVYPVNHLANFKLVYDSTNNIKIITSTGDSAVGAITTIMTPFFYVGIAYACKRVRYVAILMGLDALITLIINDYLSRHELVMIAFVCVLLYINGDLADRPVTLSKKTVRILLIGVTLMPILLSVLLELMSARVEGSRAFTMWEMVESEIGYPKHYARIHKMGTIAEVKDFFLHLLDSFVPILPTPAHNIDVNIAFSEIILGVKLTGSGFYIKLPSILGEAFLIFGESLYWLHAVVIAFMASMIYKMVGENKRLSVLWAYYTICILRVGRAGYIELSMTVLLNYLVFFAMILIIRLITNSWRMDYVKQNG